MPGKVNNLFLLGAGFTKAVFPDAPLNPSLLHSIIADNPETLLRKYQIRYRTDDIEILLTRMDLEKEELRSEQLKEDRKLINSQIAEYFQQFRFTEEILKENPWLSSFAKDVFRENDAIITLNYDCFLEGLLDYYEIWSPMKGYAGLIDNPLLDGPPNNKNILIAKIHGSEHFIEASGLPNTGKTGIGFLVDESIYPRSGRNTFFNYGMGLGKGPYIIAPSFVKITHEDIELIMIKALKAAVSANNLIIIGCSLRREDGYLWLYLTSFLNEPVENRKLVIVDPCAEKLSDKIITHYFRDIRRHIQIKTLSTKLEDTVENLINALHQNNTKNERNR